MITVIIHFSNVDFIFINIFFHWMHFKEKLSCLYRAFSKKTSTIVIFTSLFLSGQFASLYFSLFVAESNFALLENKALRRARNDQYVGEEELQHVVSVGLFRNRYYKHMCMAAMITGLNGITAGKCGHYK